MVGATISSLLPGHEVTCTEHRAPHTHRAIYRRARVVTACPLLGNPAASSSSPIPSPLLLTFLQPIAKLFLPSPRLGFQIGFFAALHASSAHRLIYAKMDLAPREADGMSANKSFGLLWRSTFLSPILRKSISEVRAKIPEILFGKRERGEKWWPIKIVIKGREGGRSLVWGFGDVLPSFLCDNSFEATAATMTGKVGRQARPLTSRLISAPTPL